MTVINTVAQEPTNPSVFHAGMADVGYFRSPDNGSSMQWITKDISNNIKSIVAAPAQPGRLYATGPREWQWHANELFISDDAGLSWRRSGLKGIPGMEERRSETVVAHPAKKNEVWITVSGAIKPGEGGPWRSTDGGQSWTWQGQGLPATDHFFRSGYWVAGPELAISADGSMIATSNDRRLLARRGPNDNSWTMLDLPAGAPNCVTADPLQTGRFYLALQDGGLWRSDDSGKSWKNIIDRDINWVAPDIKVRGRLAAVAPWGILVSNDAGATWREMSRALPYRHSRNVVCFAGEQVVVGTGGNGVFYAPLSSLQGAATSRAGGASHTAATNFLKNAAITEGTTTPDSWDLAAWKEGTLALKRDTATYASAPASLLLETQGKASGMVHQALQPTPQGSLTVEGKIKTSGSFDNVQIVLQIFDAQWKQIDWKVVANGPKSTTDWQTFQGTHIVRDNAAYALLGLSVTGTGRVWLDDVSATTPGGPGAIPQQAAHTTDAAALPVAVAANDPLLRYTGRFDWNSRTAPRAAWSASTVALKFRGTALNVRLKDSPSNRWQVEVDGVPTTTLQMTEGEHTYSVAADLPMGEHTVRLVKATEALFGTSQILGFEMNRGGKLLPLPAPARRIEVIGDSISTGYGNEAASKEEKFSHTTQNAYFTYGAIAARVLGADYTCIAWSGKKMWPDNTIPELYDHALPNEANSHWDFAKPHPDTVLINLATNDFAAGNPDEAGWTGAYKTFISRVRRNYPQAHIYCAIGPMMGDWGKDKALTTLRSYLSKTVSDVRATGDVKVHLIDFGTQDAKNGLGADWHPNIKTNQLMAEQLVQTLRRDLNW
jgi:lysophospholipase L1-like esterase